MQFLLWHLWNTKMLVTSFVSVYSLKFCGKCSDTLQILKRKPCYYHNLQVFLFYFYIVRAYRVHSFLIAIIFKVFKMKAVMLILKQNKAWGLKSLAAVMTVFNVGKQMKNPLRKANGLRGAGTWRGALSLIGEKVMGVFKLQWDNGKHVTESNLQLRVVHSLLSPCLEITQRS